LFVRISTIMVNKVKMNNRAKNCSASETHISLDPQTLLRTFAKNSFYKSRITF